MKNLLSILLLLMLSVVSIDAQVVLSDDAFVSKSRKTSSSWSSTISSPGATSISMSSSMTRSVGGATYNVAPMRTFSPSGSSYSSQIYQPFTATNPQPLRRTDDGDLEGEPGVHPGDPGDPMPIPDGIWIMMLLSAIYIITLTQHKLKQQPTKEQTKNN